MDSRRPTIDKCRTKQLILLEFGLADGHILPTSLLSGGWAFKKPLKFKVFSDKRRHEERPILHYCKIEMFSVVVNRMPHTGKTLWNEVKHLHASSHEWNVVVLHKV